MTIDQLKTFGVLGAKSIALVLAFFISLDAFASSARAPSSGGGGNQALFQRMLQQTTAERDALKVELEELKAELEKEVKAAKKLQVKLDAKNKTLDKFKESNTGMSDLLTKMRGRMEELINKFRETATNLKSVEQENAQLAADVAMRDAEIKKHSENNAQLYGIGMDLLEAYEDKGVWDAFVQKEPITQIKQAQIENMREEYRVEIEKLQLDPPQFAER